MREKYLSEGGKKIFPKVLTPTKLWAICVGTVISGSYYGWNYGFEHTNFIGMIIAYFIVTIFYTSFIFCYSELATAIPSSAGPAAYSERAFGRFPGFLAGFSILVEYLFAAPGIAISIGAYVHMLFPAVPVVFGSVICYLIFVYINCRGIESATTVEMVITIVAIVGIAIYFTVGVSCAKTNFLFSSGQKINGFTGVLTAVPYVVWFYLAAESGAMDTEECKNPQKDMPKAFIAVILTLFILSISVLFVTSEVASVSTITSSDSPLPTVLASLLGTNNLIVTILNIIGLFGLAASLHGIIMGYSRQGYTMARNNFLPKYIAHLNKRGSPVRATVCMSMIGIVCVIFGNVSAIVCVSNMGSSIMSILCLLSFFKLRNSAPNMERPYKVANPILPATALIADIVVVTGVVMATINQGCLIFVVIGVYTLAVIYYLVYCRGKGIGR